MLYNVAILLGCLDVSQVSRYAHVPRTRQLTHAVLKGEEADLVLLKS